jgi:flagellar hook-basal body complex protein FliE
MNTINNHGISNLPSLTSTHVRTANNPETNNSFANTLLDSIKQVNNLQADANNAVESLFTGEEANPAEVLTAVQKADLAFRTMMQIRNKLVAAYDELKNIRV